MPKMMIRQLPSLLVVFLKPILNHFVYFQVLIQIFKQYKVYSFYCVAYSSVWTELIQNMKTVTDHTVCYDEFSLISMSHVCTSEMVLIRKLVQPTLFIFTVKKYIHRNEAFDLCIL